MGQLGSLGPDARDIHDGFKLSRTPTPYRAFWGHDAKWVYTIAQEPNRHLSPLLRAKKGRSLRRAGLLWPRAAKILIAERLRLNTQRLVSVRLPEPVLSNTWWPFSLTVEQLTEQREKALVLWLNSTLGFLLMLLHRVETEGAWVKFKKHLLANLPVLDVQALAVTELEALASAYEGLSSDALGPFPEINTDAVRARVDGVIARVLRLPDVSVFRELLAREPVVCSKRL